MTDCPATLNGVRNSLFISLPLPPQFYCAQVVIVSYLLVCSFALEDVGFSSQLEDQQRLTEALVFILMYSEFAHRVAVNMV
jgi:hypothetical protein